MARNKAFDEQVVLDKAVKVFWQKGYEATSMQDLVDAMEIQRGSLYATFGNKQQLFLMSLQRYGEVVVKNLLEILESDHSAVLSIQKFFDQLIEHSMTAGVYRGCLVTNSAIERGISDEATKNQVLALIHAIENGFYQTLLRGREIEELSEQLDLQAASKYLTCNMQGLLVLVKVCSDRNELEAMKKICLSVLN